MSFNNHKTEVDANVEPENTGLNINGSSFEKLIENDASLAESKWKPIYAMGRAHTINQLDDPGFLHSAWELDAYIIDESMLTNNISTETAMQGWKCFLAGMVYKVPYPIPGLDLSETNTESDPDGTDISDRGGFRVRLYGSNVNVLFQITTVTQIGTDGNFTPGGITSATSKTINVPALTPGQDPDTGFVEEDLILPKKVLKGIESGDMVLIWGYFQAGDKLNPLYDEWQSLDDIRYYLSGVYIWEYPPATLKIDITRPIGGT